MAERWTKGGGPVALPSTKGVVATAMAAGAGYNTEALTWLMGHGARRKRSPNRAAIRLMSRQRRRSLRKHGKTHPDLAAVGENITACGRSRLSRRCLHPACPRCAHALQRLLVRVVHRLAAPTPKEGWVAVTIILPALNPGGEIDFQAEWERYETLLSGVGITLGVFGLDLSFNEDHRYTLPEAERFADHACVHLYGLALAGEVEAAEAELRKLVPRTDAVPRPVHVKPWDGGLAAIGYAFKSDFVRRQTILKDDPRRTNPVRDTRDRPLTVEQQIRAVRALDRAGLTGRIVLLGLHFEPAGPGQLRLVPGNSKEVSD